MTHYRYALLLLLLWLVRTACHAVPVVTYHAIRYATAQRFCESQPVELGDVLPDNERGCQCPQGPEDHARWGWSVDLPQSEDCLLLTVWAPERAESDSLLPVMVHIHGGAYHNGGGEQELHDLGEFAAREQIVCVSISYRLGVFGYLYMPDRGCVNLGLGDQMNAINWVRRYIRRFGGDPDRITLIGQSAGAQSVMYLLAEDEDLSIQRAIVFSAPAGLVLKKADAARYRREFMEELSDSTLLYTLPADSLLAAQNRVHKRHPYVAMPFAPAGLEQMPSGRRHLPRRMLVTTQRNDCGNMVPRWGWSLATNYVFRWPARRYVRYLRREGVEAEYHIFDWKPTGSPYGAAHADEMPLFSGRTDNWVGTALVGDVTTQELDSLRAAFMPRLATFVRTGLW